MTEPGTDLVPLPDGQVVDLANPTEVAIAIDDLRNLEAKIKEVKSVLLDRLQEYAGVAGEGKTLTLPGGVRAVLTGDKKVLWDAQRLEEDLRKAGMSEQRIREIVVEEVSYKVAAREANKAASVNPEYAHAVASSRREVPQRPTVKIERA